MDTQELEKLAQLKEKGIITEDEFNQKKQEILGVKSNNFQTSLSSKSIKSLLCCIALLLICGGIYYFSMIKMPQTYTENVVYCKTTDDIKLCFIKDTNKKLNGVVNIYTEDLTECHNNEYGDKECRDGLKIMAIDDEYYHEDLTPNTLMCEASFKDGKLNGIFKTYWETNILRKEVIFKNGKKDGVEKGYDSYGNLYTETTFKEGEKDGHNKRYYKSGVLEVEFYDKEYGYSKSYYESGGIKAESKNNGCDKDSCNNYTTKEYYESGTLKSEATYKNGKIISNKCYTESGSELNNDDCLFILKRDS